MNTRRQFFALIGAALAGVKAAASAIAPLRNEVSSRGTQHLSLPDYFQVEIDYHAAIKLGKQGFVGIDDLLSGFGRKIFSVNGQRIFPIYSVYGTITASASCFLYSKDADIPTNGMFGEWPKFIVVVRGGQLRLERARVS